MKIVIFFAVIVVVATTIVVSADGHGRSNAGHANRLKPHTAFDTDSPMHPKNNNNNNNNKAPKATAQQKPIVHVIPHTHDDVGWLKTLDQYMWGANMSIQEANVMMILDSVISGVQANPDRRFTYVEFAFFHRWWAQQNNATHAITRKLFQSKQITVSNGGWTMQDEANPHFIDIIDQTTLGHRFIIQELGVVPTVGWQLDPFGHSGWNAVFESLAGMNSEYHARVDYQDYNYRITHNARIFEWQPSKSLPERKLMGEINFDTTYCNSGWGWDVVNFNFDNDVNNMDWVIDDPNMPDAYNAKHIVDKFVDQAMRRAAITNGPAQMSLYGCDFNYLGGSTWFTNTDKLIRLVNADGRVEARYSTPEEYTAAKLAELGEGKRTPFPVKTDDFFPYADGAHHFWTGYFTSRPALKRYIRSTSSYWTTARQLHLLFGVPTGEGRDDGHIMDALGIAQHHDAVAGTAKQHVAFDYAKRLARGYNQDMAQLSQKNTFDSHGLMHCERANESECAATASLSSGESRSIYVWNSDGHARAGEWIEIPVPFSYCSIESPYATKVVEAFPSNDGTGNYRKNPKALPYTVAAQMNLPAAGYATGIVDCTNNKNKKSSSAAPLSNNLNKKKKQTSAAGSNSHIVVDNDYLTLTFSTSSGLLETVFNKETKTAMSVVQDYCTYLSCSDNNLDCAMINSQQGGAYIMRTVPKVNCTPLSNAVSIHVVSQTAARTVVEQDFGHVSQRVTLGAGDRDFSIEFTVYEVPVMTDPNMEGKELMMRIKTNVSNMEEFYTDSNGRDFIWRKINYRPSWPFVQTERVAGNFFPVNAAILMNDTSSGFGVATDTSVSGSVLYTTESGGEVFLDIHRRLLVDDSRGVGEPINETENIAPYYYCSMANPPCGAHTGRPLRVRGKFRVIVSDKASLVDHVRTAMDKQYFLPQVFYGKSSSTPHNAGQSDSLLIKPMDDQLQLITAHLITDTDFIVRIAHKYAIDEYHDNGSKLASPVTLSLAQLFSKAAFPGSGYKVTRINEVTITTNQLIKNDVDVITVKPLDVRSFVFEISKA